jgi:hypothetical protein
MKIETFRMEREQCLYENKVEFNLSESGVLPLQLDELLDGDMERARFLAQRMWYPSSDGSPRLREQIAKFYPDCTPENVTVTNGGSEANYVTLMSLLEESDRLACMLPNYMQAWGLGRTYADGSDAFHLVPGISDGHNRWALDIDELKRVVTKRTKVILVTNPNNPTGAVLNEEEMNAVVEGARNAKAWLVVDEIYRGAEYDGLTTPTFWGRYDKVVVTSGLSKAFAMPGLRLGWVVAPPKLIEKLWIHHDYLTLTPNVFSDYIAAIAMEPVRREALLTRTKNIIKKNLPPLEAWITENADLFNYIRPLAGAIAYFTYNPPIRPQTLIDRLRVEESVLLVPANHFGMSHKGIRTGYGYDIDKTLKGLMRLEAFMRRLKV